MAKWKLCRQTFGNEEFEFTEGDEVRIGRGLDNTITLSSIVISRHHCIINVKRDGVFITDLKSSNGIYIGLKRISPNIPYELSDNDLIGFGWTVGAPVAKIKDTEKYVFKLIKCEASIVSRIQFQSNSDEEIEIDITSFKSKECNPEIKSSVSPTSKSKLQLKRKLNVDHENVNVKKEPVQNKPENDIINIISDSDNESKIQECIEKKIKLDPIIEDLTKDEVKNEFDDLQYEAFKVKQEYLGYDDDEPIQIDSDSDSESEQWLLRLSQSSPGKPFIKVSQNTTKPDTSLENSSYSQLDDVVFNNIEHNNDEEYFFDDIIFLPPEPPKVQSSTEINQLENELPSRVLSEPKESENQFSNQINQLENELPLTVPSEAKESEKDVVDGVGPEDNIQKLEEAVVPTAPVPQSPHTLTKKAQMIEPLVKSNKRKSHHSTKESKIKNTISDKKKSKHHSSSTLKKAITNSQKEERRRKLKEIAVKEKEPDDDNKKLTNTANKSVTNVKVTTSNRGAFLTDVVQATVKPMKRNISQEKEKTKIPASNSEPIKESSKSKKSIEKSKKHEKANSIEANVSVNGTTIEKDNQKDSKRKSRASNEKSQVISSSDHRIPFRSLKPLDKNKESMSGKPVFKVEPLPPVKPKKRVRFSDAKPVVHEFEIEPGNKMNKTSSVKTRLLDVQCVRQKPIFSLEKITLMKILRWNPQWLDEQITTPEPPPILGHNNPPMAIFHSFNSHSQYIGQIGDLLLMEIWECLTQAYMRIRNQTNRFILRIESLPPVPPQEKFYELCNLRVNVSLPTSETKHLPRVGDIMMLEFGPDNAKICRFFFVHFVRCLPSPPNNRNSFFSLDLYATFTDKMMDLKRGEVMIGRNLAYINKELTLFEAMEYLIRSPLSQIILRPDSHEYQINECDTINFNTQWTSTLNPSQKLAVSQSVSAALGNKPSLQMVQGPPGTGKSSVICAIVMSYFYDAMNKRQQDRGKILICATSNAAVDELVIRLLNIRQSLPKEERFRMVRVGRLEAMHARARDVSSQQLAQRDAERARAQHAPPGRDEEISHLEAKINMWKTQARDTKDPVRVAYCQSRVENLVSRISLLRGGGDELRPERLAQAERRIVDCAHIVVTTLASAHNYKMKGLKGRIALCIVDEAGQAIEPEALIPLTLDVTRLTLIGDPQQLPGFICSQRAKQHGLGESLFSRLSASSARGAVMLDRQYRMHPAIADYPNRAFYAGRVSSEPPPPRLAPLALPPYALLAIDSGDKGQVQSGANETEAWGVARVAAALAAGVRERRCSLAVITPYSAHRDLLRSCLRALQHPSEPPVEVNTVDSFQGQERDVVVVSLARSHGVGFLTDAGRMNVMLTRARHALLVCLNPLALVKNTQWQTLVDDARKRGVYKTLPNKICVPASARPIPNDEVLKYVKNR